MAEPGELDLQDPDHLRIIRNLGLQARDSQRFSVDERLMATFVCALCDEVSRLRAENARLVERAAELEGKQ